MYDLPGAGSRLQQQPLVGLVAVEHGRERRGRGFGDGVVSGPRSCTMDAAGAAVRVRDSTSDDGHGRHSRSSSVTSSGAATAGSAVRVAHRVAGGDDVEPVLVLHGRPRLRVERAGRPARGELVRPLRLGHLVRLAAPLVPVGFVLVVVGLAVGLRRGGRSGVGRSTPRYRLPA